MARRPRASWESPIHACSGKKRDAADNADMCDNVARALHVARSESISLTFCVGSGLCRVAAGIHDL